MLFSFQGANPKLLFRRGGDEEDRTPYPLLARQVLSQMSYTPTFSLSPFLTLLRKHALKDLFEILLTYSVLMDLKN